MAHFKTKEEIEQKLHAILKEELHIENINNKTVITTEIVDSLDFVQMIMTIEDEFDIEITDEDAGNLKTVQDVVNYVAVKYDLKEAT